MESNYLGLDFEYNEPAEPHMGLVSVDFCRKGVHSSVWLHKGAGRDRAVAILERARREGMILVAHNAVAEANCMIALGLDPRRWPWKDTMLEYRQLQNGNAKWAYGWQWKSDRLFGGTWSQSFPLIPPNRLKEMDGMFGEDRERLLEQAKRDGRSHEVVPPSLLNAVRNMLGVELDAGEKDGARALILERKEVYSEAEQARILAYGASDTEYLIPLLEKLTEEIGPRAARAGLGPEQLHTAQLWRGRAATNVATYTMAGMPVSRKRWQNLVANKAHVIREGIEDFAGKYGWLWEWDRSAGRYAQKRTLTDAWVERLVAKHGLTSWPKTADGNYSLSTAEGQPLQQYRDLIPEVLEFCRLQEMMKGLGAHADEAEAEERRLQGKKVFGDHFGSDDRVRPWYGPFGTQTGRNAPAAVGFIPAQSGWLRGLIEPPPGRVLMELDFSSQEAFIGAVLSGDAALLKAYESGDPYMAFAIDAGAAPVGATKKTHGEIRGLFKSTVLGLQYGMGAAKLAVKLTADTGKTVTVAKAKELIDLHRKVYHVYYGWKDRIWDAYRHGDKPILLPDFWYLDTHNSSRLSTLNCPIQGGGSSMMRHMVDIALDGGFQVVCPVHDSMIVECGEDEVDFVAEMIQAAMVTAAERTLGVKGMRVGKPEILRHGEYWITEKNADALGRYRKYFEAVVPKEAYLETFLKED